MTVGQIVTMKAFTDCFGVFHPERPDLTVVSVKKEIGISIPDYLRTAAVGPHDFVEAAERFFTTKTGS